MTDVRQRSLLDTTLEPRSTRARRDGRPSVSVVFMASDDSPALLREMAERSSRWQRLGVELIVVCSSRLTTATIVSLMSGEARVVYGPPNATDLQLRAKGLAAASGDVVMMVDDPASADDGWIEHLSARCGASGAASA